MHRVDSFNVAGKKRKNTNRRIPNLQRTAACLLLVAVLATFSSIPLFLGVLHGIDSKSGEGEEVSGVSIRALHILQQTKAHAMHSSFLERPIKPCIDENEDLLFKSKYVVPNDAEIIENIPLPVFPYEPKPHHPSLSQNGGSYDYETEASSGTTVGSEGKLGNNGGKKGWKWATKSGRSKSLIKDDLEKKEEKAPLSWFDNETKAQTWRKGLKTCHRWAVRVSKITEMGLNLSAISTSSFVKLELLLPYSKDDSKQEAPREAWNNDTMSLQKAMVNVGSVSLGIRFWREKYAENNGSVSDEKKTVGEGKEGEVGWEEVSSVKSLQDSVRKQIDIGGLISLVPEKAPLLSVDLCVPPGMHLLDESKFPWGLGVQLSVFVPKLKNGTTQHRLAHVRQRCELKNAPLLHYVVPAGGAWNPPAGPLRDLPSPAGQLAVTWESNCNAALHRLAICRGSVGPCVTVDLDCEESEEGSVGCKAERMLRNGTVAQKKRPDAVVEEVSTVKISNSHWVHTIRVPMSLPPGRYRYQVRTGSQWSHISTFRMLMPPLLPIMVPRNTTDDVPKVGKKRHSHFLARSGIMRLRNEAKKSANNVEEAKTESKTMSSRIGQKSVLGRKTFERGLIGVSNVDIDNDEWVHVAIVSDSQNGMGTFRRHLSHVRTHRPHADVMLHLGDRVQSGSSLRDWSHCWIYPLLESGVGSQAAFVGVNGNHDSEDSGLRHAFGPLPSSRGWYSMVIGNCLVIGLDSNVGPMSDETQGEWLKSTLERVWAARKKGIAPSFVIILVHIPPFVDYWDPKAWVQGEERHWGEWVRLDWVPLFEKYKVDLVISGHSHVYQRGERNGVMYAVVGGGGGKIDKKRVEDWKMYKVTHLGYHYVWMDVSSNKLSWTAYDIANNPIDHVLFQPEEFEIQ